jgi:hypothetical protein
MDPLGDEEVALYRAAASVTDAQYRPRGRAPRGANSTRATGNLVVTRLIPWALALAFGLGCVWLVHRAWTTEADAARAAEASRLAADGQIVELRKTADELKRDLDVELESNTALQDALDQARKVAPGAKVTRTVRASTGPMVAGGVARECPVPPQAPGCACPAAPACLVAPGDSLEVNVSEVDLQAKEGTRVVVGTGECSRVLPLPRTSLAIGKFEARLTTVTELEPIPRDVTPTLGLGVAAFASGQGTALGLAIAPPPLRLWALDLDLTLAAGTGSGGPHGSATAVGRFWK